MQALISATHALSFYSLTLRHGVPFQPVSIRVSADPLSLLGKVLEQNPKSYTRLDDMLSIGRDLVSAGLPIYASSLDEDDRKRKPCPQGSSEAKITAERRIISMAISSALSANDFGTAYSYILTRLTPPSFLPPTKSMAASSISSRDDTSWRAVYAAGRHRYTNQQTSSLSPQITHLSQRMELLSLALFLVPSPDPLPEILGAWRRCDEELGVLRTREAEEAESWDVRGDATTAAGRAMPGGFGPSDSERDAAETEYQHARRARQQHHGHRHRAAADEEAPMGLFEVARGAAMALRKNAFPLRDGVGGERASSSSNNSRNTSRDHSVDPAASGGGDDDMGEEGRVRKRDVVSNMVTGGLVSGIGWVIGANPVNDQRGK